MMSYYKKIGYDIKKYPVTFMQYSNEISLPVFYDLTDDQVAFIIHTINVSVEEELQIIAA